MNTESAERIKELCKDEEYIQHLLSLGNAEKMAEDLTNKGVEITADEVRLIGKLICKKEEGQLSDEELEEIAGGISIGLIVLGVFFGVAAAGTTAGFVYSVVKTCKSGC